MNHQYTYHIHIVEGRVHNQVVACTEGEQHIASVDPSGQLRVVDSVRVVATPSIAPLAPAVDVVVLPFWLQNLSAIRQSLSYTSPAPPSLYQRTVSVLHHWNFSTFPLRDETLQYS